MAVERLQKVLAAAGVASRRGADALIAAGRVTVDGKPAKPGTQVDPMKAIVAVDGRVIGAAAGHAYLVLHKPGGVTSTTRDRHATTTVMELIPTALVPDGARLYPVGRLDQDSEGMLLLTNDGGWADRVLHPRHGVEREYALGLATALDGEQVDRLRAGIPLDEGLATLGGLRPMTNVETARLADLMRPAPSRDLVWYRATLEQGWKRQLRRMFGAVGAPVQRLVRVRIGPVRLDGLQSGTVRRLKAPEIRGLGAGGGRSRGAAPVEPDAPPTTFPGRPAPRSGGPRRSRGPAPERPASTPPGSNRSPRPGPVRPPRPD
jgi:23S rRNA pseudouridine2605 synthase